MLHSPSARVALLVKGPGVHDGWASRSLQSTDQKVAHHRRLAFLIQLDHVLRAQLFQRISTIPTAPSTIFCRAAMIALACCRRSIAFAISGAYAR